MKGLSEDGGQLTIEVGDDLRDGRFEVLNRQSQITNHQ
jgi:hypothetical protein